MIQNHAWVEDPFKVNRPMHLNVAEWEKFI